MSELPRLALSVRQPWAWAIIHAGKDFENRSRAALRHMPVPYSFRVAVHASLGLTRIEYEDARDFMESIDVICPPAIKLSRGGLIGTVELVGQREESASMWSFGPGIELRNARAVEFVPACGRLGLFDWRAAGLASPAQPAKWMLPENHTVVDRVIQEELFGGAR